MNNRILFLDVDGVLNSQTSMEAYGEYFRRQMNPMSVMLLHRILMASKAQVVVSSSWRLESGFPNEFLKYLHQAGWPESTPFPLHSTTPELDPTNYSRGDEIIAWLNEHMRHHVEPWKDFIIIDDINDFHDFQPVVLCDDTIGLSAREFNIIAKRWDIVDSSAEDYYDGKTVLENKKTRRPLW